MRLRARLKDGPIRRTELDQVGGRDRVYGLGLWVDMVRLPPSGTWARRRADIYGGAEEWLGPPPADLTPARGVELLVKRYLGGYGPATRNEIADWGGLPMATLNPALERLRLRRFRAEDGRELLDLPGAPLPDPETPAPVRFLPEWDAILLAHARRKKVLLEQHRPLVFNTRTPHSVATFLVDGVVAGAWKWDGTRVRVEPYRKLTSAEQREVGAEADRLAELWA